MNITIFGPQGSGKSTQAKLLAEKKGMFYVSPGDVLREMYDKGTERGKEAYTYWGKGELVPDDLLDELLAEWLKKQGYDGEGVVTDGYPRRLPQLKGLDEGNLWGPVDVAVYITLDEETARERLRLRRDIEHRLDETPEAIRKRLENYHKATEPLLNIYKERGILIEIDGAPSIEEVHEDIMHSIPS